MINLKNILLPGDTINNEKLCEIFKCSPQGGMRRSLTTNTLVLIANHVESIYRDRWNNEIFHYTGMGSREDQRLDFAQNRTLAESSSNGVNVYLFEVFEKRKYLFQGQVKLAGDPYQEEQTDADGNVRDVWMFPLQLLEGHPAIINIKQIERLDDKEEKKVKKLTKDQIKTIAESLDPKKSPSERKVESFMYDRDERVKRYARERASGICDLCQDRAPFNKRDGSPFLEVHHIDYMSKGGSDTIDNVCALCPNCHRKMHALENIDDYNKLKKIASIRL